MYAQHQRRFHILIGILFAILIALIVFAVINHPKAKATSTQTAAIQDDDGGSTVTSNAQTVPAGTTSNSGCDPALWNHVYHPSRLKIIDNCKTVSGTITVIRHEPDGDYHILLQLDPQYDSLLNDKNKTAQHSDLVLEPVCEDSVTQSDAVNACQGYKSPVKVPPVGTRVYVTGSYVLDTEHGWNEIHPVSAISTTPPAQTQPQANTPQQPTPSQTPAASGVVKLSRTGICHTPTDPNYAETTNFTPYDTLDACLAAGGRLPK